MDDSADGAGDFGAIPQLDESFVLGAVHHEPSYRERQLERERRGAKQDIYGAELDNKRDGAQGARRPVPTRRLPRTPRSATSRPNRWRQIVGVVIAAAVVVVAVDLPGRLSGRHSSSLGLVSSGNQTTSCPSDLYAAGAEYRFERCEGGKGLAWDRCDTLTVAVNPESAPDTWQHDTDNALSQVGQATGLHFKRIASGKADITIAWTAALLTAGGADADKAGVTGVTFSSSLVGSRLTAANIEISTHLEGGSGRNGELPVILHEMGHAVGLGHFDGPEVMNPVDQGYATYQPGDIAGLAALYQPDNCR